ncbi:MAG: PKD domain containing protein [Candidatus Nomurabacteria bacterium GW2011_GWD1_44_10]|nr:MAG: PKD domain containing protein [Candidatus Nomurabacteria bacterium GW2011_GWD1_44_10]
MGNLLIMNNSNNKTSYGVKKLLMVILIASIVSPTFAFADNDKFERKGENRNNSQKSVQMAQKSEKKELKNEVKSIKREIKEVKKEIKKIEIKEVKSFKKDDDHDDDNYKKYRLATTTATTTPIQTAKKTNYFLCKTDSGWNVVQFEGVKNKNSNNALGKYCMKLPHGFTKKFYGKTATSTPDIVAPVISGITVSGMTTTSAIVAWATDEIANGNIYISTSTPMNLASSTTLGSVTFSTAHSFSITGLTANTTYYYVVKSADSAGNTATSSEQSFVTPAVADTVAPVISAVSASGVTSSLATVSWTTNEVANGNVYVSTSTPVNLATATTLGTTTLSLAHSFSLSSLTASTTYYYVVKSADSAGNTATSSEQSFTTPAVTDTTAPVISSIITSPVASTTATVSWNTNELATGKLWYGTSTPLTLYMQNTTPSLAHLFNLIGLTASATYNLLLESVDGASNTATSTASLTTTN